MGMRVKMEFRQRLAGVAFLLICAVAGIWAQGNVNIPIPYSCSFEDPAENANWVINSGIAPPADKVSHYDRWYIERATQTDGLYSLFISNDGGMTTQYDTRRNVIVAYREIAMPQGTYEFSFDWKNNASQKSSISGLYVCLVPSNMFSAPQSDPNSSTLQRWTSFKQSIETEGNPEPQPLKGTLDWKNSSFQQSFNGTGETYYLTFAWVNDERDTLPNSIGACIDNIQITSAACARPKNLTVETMCDTIKVSWDGICDYYDLEWKLSEQTTWHKIPQLRDRKYVLSGVNEGVYDFRVRGTCYDSIYSAYAYKNSCLLFCAEEHCINFIDLKNAAQCYVGTTDGYSEPVIAPSVPVDMGPDDIRSRHVVNTARNQFDPRTGYGLATIPEGELASVRIGNWNYGAEVDRIEYQFPVDCSVASILLLKYAIVFQDPNHPKNEQPHFNLLITDEYGNAIDTDCGAASFYADSKAVGWHEHYNDFNLEPIAWKDWTTLGINLRPYDGQTITIQITVNDCGAGAHYGYAYFTLGCASGEIESVSCGELDSMTVKAPDGFGYEWFKEYEYITNGDGTVDSLPKNVVGTEQELKIEANDRDVYYCRCSFIDPADPGKADRCHFDLNTVVSPREPFADFDWEWVPTDCRNEVKFYNRSHVLTVVDGDITHTDEATQTTYWTVNGRQEMVNDFTYTVPQEGDSLHIHLLAGISHDECRDDTTLSIYIPSILCEADTVDSTVCEGTPVTWGKTVTTMPGYIPDSAKNVAGCDSIVVLNLRVIPAIPDTKINDTICHGDSLMFGGEWIKEAGEYPVWYETQFGCDSVVVLNLTVRDEVTFDYEVQDVVDEPRSGAITITDAPKGYSYTLNGVEVAPLTHLNGGYYNLIVYDSIGCPSEEVEVFINQDCLEFNLTADTPYMACGDEDSIVLPCEFLSGAPSTYSIVYDDKALAAGFVNYEDTFDVNEITILLPDSCRPDYYTAELTVRDIICEDTVIPLSFSVYYPADIVRQKWNNVLAVTNSGYNGGYEFAAFQWYKDGMPLTGEIGSYLYLGEGNMLDTAAVYHVLLTRADDGVSVPTCPMSATVHSDVMEFPKPATSVAQANAPMRILNVREAVDVMVFNAAGQLLADERVDVATPEVLLPSVPGVYMMVIQTESSCTPYKIVVR